LLKAISMARSIAGCARRTIAYSDFGDWRYSNRPGGKNAPSIVLLAVIVWVISAGFRIDAVAIGILGLVCALHQHSAVFDHLVEGVEIYTALVGRGRVVSDLHDLVEGQGLSVVVSQPLEQVAP
jgi:hypothetical protein